MTGNSESVESLVDSNRDYAQVLAESIDATPAVLYHYGDDLINQTRNNEIHHFHIDGLGRTRVLTDSIGSQSDSFAYDAFGDLVAREGSNENSYLFAGEQYDVS